MLLALTVALLAPVISPYDPLKQDLGHTLGRPDRAHLMGTDNVGRDVLSRMIWGTRVSLLAGFGSVALAMIAGGILGLLAGYAGGQTDGFVMRLMDAVLSSARARPRAGCGAGGGARRRGHRSRRGVYADLRAPHARAGADDHHARVRGGGPGPGRPRLAGGVAPRAAERRRSHRDPSLAERGLRHPRRGLAVVPRPGCAAARRVMGQHDQRGTRLSAAGALDRLLAGRGAIRDSGGIELRRGRGARCPRPAAEKVSQTWSTSTRCAAVSSIST